MKYLICLIYFGFMPDIVFSADFKPKIAIIGAGIGGTSCALFLKEYFENNGTEVEIHVYEKNNVVGGRMNSIKIDGIVYELGPSKISIKDEYTNKLFAKFGLGKIFSKTKSTVVYNENRLQPANNGYWKRIKDFPSNFKTELFVNDMDKLFTKIYPIVDKKTYYLTVNEMLDMHELKFLPMKSMEYCLDKYKVSTELIEASNACLIRSYGQHVAIQAFAGYVALKNTIWRGFSAKEGNAELPKRCLKESGAILHIKEKVVKLLSLSDERTRVFFVKNGKLNKMDFNYVVLATPLAENLESIEFKGFPNVNPIKGLLFIKTVITIVKGSLKAQFFGSDVNSKIAESAEDIIFVDRRHNIDFISKLSLNVWKIRSSILLTSVQLNEIFNIHEVLKVFVSDGFPDYKSYHLEDGDRFYVGPNLFYINCIEWAASSVEMSIIGARNVAILIYRKYNGWT